MLDMINYCTDCGFEHYGRDDFELYYGYKITREEIMAAIEDGKEVNKILCYECEQLVLNNYGQYD